MKPRLLDLFCGAGGAAKGYQRAGFDVTGVDNRPQPHYCGDRFLEGDAFAVLRTLLKYGTICGGLGLRRLRSGSEDFVAIHASPPCQFASRATAWRGDRSSHRDLITPLRPLLEEIGLPYVIENVQEARRMLRNPLMLCGSAVGLPIQRHRYFETNWPCSVLTHPCRHRPGTDRAFEHKAERAYADAMDCEWMTSYEARQAIPPAYTELIGHQLIQHIQRVAA